MPVLIAIQPFSHSRAGLMGGLANHGLETDIDIIRVNHISSLLVVIAALRSLLIAIQLSLPEVHCKPIIVGS